MTDRLKTDAKTATIRVDIDLGFESTENEVLTMFDAIEALMAERFPNIGTVSLSYDVEDESSGDGDDSFMQRFRNQYKLCSLPLVRLYRRTGFWRCADALHAT